MNKKADFSLYFYTGEPDREQLRQAFVAFKFDSLGYWEITKNRLTGKTGDILDVKSISGLINWMSK